ncbi:hypothetical protein ACT7C6_14900 [Bacillus paranthracis]
MNVVFKREDVQIEAKELYEVYANWCFRNGEHQLKNRAFYRILETQGFKENVAIEISISSRVLL